MKKVPISAILEEKTTTQDETEQVRAVRTIEMNSKFVDLYNRTEASKEITCKVGNVKMPKLLAYAACIMSKQHSGSTINAIMNTILAKNAQMLTGKGVKYVEKGNIGYCNYYAINFMPSGSGKDLMSNELDNFVYYPFRSWFKCTVQELREKFRFELEQEARHLHNESLMKNHCTQNLQGINNASNNFIHILHTDDILSPNCIQFEQELINKYPGNLFINHIHHAFENEFYSNEHNEYKIECPKTSWLKSKIFTDCTVPSAWCFNKKILKDINFTKGEFAFVYDWNFLFSVLVYLYKNELTFIEIPQGYVGWREHSDSESTKGILTCFTEWKRLALLMANELQECGILNKKEIKRVLKKSEKCRIKRIIKDYEKNKKNFKLPQDVLFKYYWKLLLKFIYSKEKQPASHRIIYRILGFKISKKSTKNYKKCSIKNSKVPLIIDGDFYNLKNFPIKAKNYQLQSDAYTIPSLCIVIQGPIVKENDFTLETCKIYKKIFNNSETIILSTWDTEDKKYLKNFEAIGVKVLLSKAPDFAGRANLNYQILSTMKGLEEGEKLGCEYAIKTRTDQRFYSTNLSRDLFNLLKIYPPSPNYNMHSRLVALSFNSFKYRYYGISDMFLFGNTQDMLKYWNSPLDTKKYEEYKTIKQKDLWQQYCSETYIKYRK